MTTDEITSMAQQADAMLTIRALPDNAELKGGASAPSALSAVLGAEVEK